MQNILSIQICPELGRKQENYKKIETIISSFSNNKIDLILMPEFFSTGIDDKVLKTLAEEETNSETLEFFSNVARKYNTNIVPGTIIEKENEKLYNTSYFINRKGQITGKYRKINLFNYFGGSEGDTITPGEKIVVVNSDIGKIGMSICFDIRFPLHYNKLLKAGAEIIICPAAWSLEGSEEWDLCNRSIALNNTSYVISSCLCGSTMYDHSGNSMIVDPFGKIVTKANRSECGILAEIDVNKVKELRKNFPAHTFC